MAVVDVGAVLLFLPLPLPFLAFATLIGSDAAVRGGGRCVSTSGGDAEEISMGLVSVLSASRRGGAKSPRFGHLRERA